MKTGGKGILVTATGTGVGKTFVSSALLRGLTERGDNCCGLKPIASGCLETEAGLRNEDACALMESASVKLGYEQVNRYAFIPPVSPHAAAGRAGVEIDPHLVGQDVRNAMRIAETTIVEGVGGWEVPISENMRFSGLARQLGLPVVMVAGIELGCINHAILTANAIQSSGLTMAGWIANYHTEEGDGDGDSVEAIRSRISAPLLAIVPYSHSPGSSWRPDGKLLNQLFRI